MEKVKRAVSLPRALSKLGYTSRSQAEKLVAAGKVKVNGKTITSLSFRVDPLRDKISIEGKNLQTKKEFVYFLLHKPIGVVTTRSDERGRKTVYDFLPAQQSFLFPVGRLDKDTSGALLMTNDSQLGEQLTNPKSKFPKTYEVECNGELTGRAVDMLMNGVELNDGYTTLPAEISGVRYSGEHSQCEITIVEGKNRQIRRMFDAVGFPVRALKRIAIGSLRLGSLAEGNLRQLTTDEIKNLKR